MSIKIVWVPSINADNKLEANISHIPPENAFSFYIKNREDSRVMMCPAVAAYLKNCFIIRSPYEITISYDADTKTVTTDRYGQAFFESRILLETFEKSPAVLHLFPQYLFIPDTKKSVRIETLPMFFGVNNYAVVPGTFDISKWIRPIEFGIEVPDTCIIKLKREDPLFMVKFITEDNDTVILEQGIQTQELYQASMSCVSAKGFNPNLNLNKLYTMADGYINLVKKTFFKR